MQAPNGQKVVLVWVKTVLRYCFMCSNQNLVVVIRNDDGFTTINLVSNNIIFLLLYWIWVVHYMHRLQFTNDIDQLDAPKWIPKWGCFIIWNRISLFGVWPGADLVCVMVLWVVAVGGSECVCVCGGGIGMVIYLCAWWRDQHVKYICVLYLWWKYIFHPTNLATTSTHIPKHLTGTWLLHEHHPLPPLPTPSHTHTR